MSLSILPLPSVFEQGSITVLSTYTAALSLSPSLNNNFFSGVMQIPPFVRTDRSISLYAVLQASTANATPGLFINFQVGLTRFPLAGALVEAAFAFDWPVPNPWAVAGFDRILCDDGSGVTFPAGTFTTGDSFAVRFRRIGGASTDTYPNAMKVGLALDLEYSLKTGAGSGCVLC
jgi:hypothetical protein